jgi:hypothetical protein
MSVNCEIEFEKWFEHCWEKVVPTYNLHLKDTYRTLFYNSWLAAWNFQQARLDRLREDVLAPFPMPKEEV